MRYRDFRPEPIYYFAYGMLTDQEHMPGARAVGSALLNNHRFEFLQYADVTPDAGSQVWGALWIIPRELLSELDRVEGYPHMYGRQQLPVQHQSRRVEAWVYRMTPSTRDNTTWRAPSQGYVATLRRGYRAFGLPSSQIDQALEVAEAQDSWQQDDAAWLRDLREMASSGPDAQEMRQRMRAAGYAFWGEGVDSIVWGKHEGTVVKIVMPMPNQGRSRQAAGNRAILAYRQWAQEHSNNPHMLRFGTINGQPYRKIRVGQSEFLQLSMEALEELPTAVREFLGQLLNQGVWHHFPTWQDFLRHARQDSRWTQLLDALMERYREQMPGFYNIASQLRQWGAGQGLGWDLAGFNVRQRRDGTMVIVDPFGAGWSLKWSSAA